MSTPGCTCQTPFPECLEIQAGLSSATFRPLRALGAFPEWRLALLESIGNKPTLDGWRARNAQDLGLMLVEMGAYVADVVSFYDAIISAESYLRTASLPGSRRELVSLLGYKPRPAVASQVLLAAKADGTKPVVLPKGTAFRSSEFLDERQAKQAPQVFELTEVATLDPRINELTVEPVKIKQVTAPFDRLPVKTASVRLKTGDFVVVDMCGTLETAWVKDRRPISSRTAEGVEELRFTSFITPPPGGCWYSNIRVLAPGLAARLWQKSNAYAINGSLVLLESQTAILPDEVVLFKRGVFMEARRVYQAKTVSQVLLSGLTSQVLKPDKTLEGQLKSPDISVNTTQLTLYKNLNWYSSDAGTITLYHALSPAAEIVEPVKESLEKGDSISLPSLIDPPRVTASRVLLEDRFGEGLEAKGSLSASSRSATLDPATHWTGGLSAPIRLLGNVLSASRGESVWGEVLGAGDASKSTLTFKLKKKPLTYLSAPTASGMASTLQVRVGGVLWKEVPTFFGCKPSDHSYTVSHDEDGETYVTFGGAARPGTGAAIVADYRHGAGAALPPAGSVKQLSKPVTGLKTVKNVLPAFGGADAESSAELASNAPRSALLLGRAVSLPDLEAATACVPGVKATRASWRMDEAGLQPAAIVTYIGDVQLMPEIRAKLRNLAEPGAPIRVTQSLPQTARLSIQLLIDPDFVASEVLDAAMQALYAAPVEPGSGGLLRPERLGPGGVIYASVVIEALMALEGVLDLQSMRFNEAPPAQPAFRPDPGKHWDFGEQGKSGFGISITGSGHSFQVTTPALGKPRRKLRRRMS